MADAIVHDTTKVLVSKSSSVLSTVSPPTMNTYQVQYWNELVQLKFQNEYLHEYLLRDQTINRRLEFFLAVTSSSSIGGWVIWSDIGFLWATAIAASQVVAALKHLLPMGERLRRLTGFRSELQELVLLAECRWFDVAEGRLGENGIHDLRVELKRRKAEAEQRYFGDTALPRRKTLLKRAERSTNEYFDAHYSNGSTT